MEVWENEKLQSREIPRCFELSQTFTSVSITYWDKEKYFSISFNKITSKDLKRGSSRLYQSVNSAYTVQDGVCDGVYKIARYLFMINRYRVAASNATRKNFSQKINALFLVFGNNFEEIIMNTSLFLLKQLHYLLSISMKR